MTDDVGAEELRELNACLEPFGDDRGNLIPILQRIQEKLAYLPPEALFRVARHQFRFHPPGKHPIKVCLGTACHVRGGEIILENFERKLGIQDGQTTEDREFSIDRVACVGCCALAPVALVEDKVHGHMAPSKVEGLILGFRLEKERREREKERDD
jgi:NADH-quinone oxidoreductase subunit E